MKAGWGVLDGIHEFILLSKSAPRGVRTMGMRIFSRQVFSNCIHLRSCEPVVRDRLVARESLVWRKRALFAGRRPEDERQAAHDQEAQ